MVLRLLLPLLFGVAGTAVLVWLGVWQMQRLAWKETVLSEIDARISAAPSALPTVVDPNDDRYLPVRVSGSTGKEDILVQSSLKRIGAGFRVIAPFTLADGRTILLDRGFLRASEKATPRPPVSMAVEGNLHWPDELDRFTPDPDIAGRLWFARDIPSLAAALEADPVLVVARATSVDQTPIFPHPVDSSGIPNDHLQYAVTWFGLAAVWVVMTAAFLRSRLREPPANLKES
ncbi:MAG: SURF1 family protein [Pseudomonadota bacterium]